MLREVEVVGGFCHNSTKTCYKPENLASWLQRNGKVENCTQCRTTSVAMPHGYDRAMSFLARMFIIGCGR